MDDGTHDVGMDAKSGPLSEPELLPDMTDDAGLSDGVDNSDESPPVEE